MKILRLAESAGGELRIAAVRKALENPQIPAAMRAELEQGLL